MAKKYKRPGDPFEKGDPVWIMNLGGKNRAGFFGRNGATVGTVFVSVGPTSKGGWWIDLDANEVRHRFPTDGIVGDEPGSAAPERRDDAIDPLR